MIPGPKHSILEIGEQFLGSEELPGMLEEFLGLSSSNPRSLIVIPRSWKAPRHAGVVPRIRD
jgi:hypothetical protein